MHEPDNAILYQFGEVNYKNSIIEILICLGRAYVRYSQEENGKDDCCGFINQ